MLGRGGVVAVGGDRCQARAGWVKGQAVDLVRPRHRQAPSYRLSGRVVPQPDSAFLVTQGKHAAIVAEGHACPRPPARQVEAFGWNEGNTPIGVRVAIALVQPRQQGRRRRQSCRGRDGSGSAGQQEPVFDFRAV